MTIESAKTKLERNGYKVVGSMQGAYIATKAQRSYKAQTMNGLIQKIF